MSLIKELTSFPTKLCELAGLSKIPSTADILKTYSTAANELGVSTVIWDIPDLGTLTLGAMADGAVAVSADLEVTKSTQVDVGFGTLTIGGASLAQSDLAIDLVVSGKQAPLLVQGHLARLDIRDPSASNSEPDQWQPPLATVRVDGGIRVDLATMAVSLDVPIDVSCEGVSFGRFVHLREALGSLILSDAAAKAAGLGNASFRGFHIEEVCVDLALSTVGWQDLTLTLQAVQVDDSGLSAKALLTGDKLPPATQNSAVAGFACKIESLGVDIKSNALMKLGATLSLTLPFLDQQVQLAAEWNRNGALFARLASTTGVSLAIPNIAKLVPRSPSPFRDRHRRRGVRSCCHEQARPCTVSRHPQPRVPSPA